MASIDGVRYGPARTEPADLSAPRGRGFSVPLGEGMTLPKTGSGPETAPMTDIAALPAGVLAVQEFGSEPVAERVARRRGLLLLRQLNLLQIALLSEESEEPARERLEGLAAALEESLSARIDPRLRSLLGSLALRARIELARPRP